MQRTHWLRTATVVAAVATASAAAQAAEGIFIMSEGIKSPSDVRGLPKDSFQATSFQWGVGRAISNSGGKREVSPAAVSDITWTQPYNSSYNAMNQRLLTNTVGKTEVFFGRSGQDGKFEESLKIETKGSAFTSLSVSSGGERPSVSASQAFAEFKIEYKAIDPITGKPGAAETLTYDRKTATLLAGSASRLNNKRGNVSSGEASGLYLRLGSGGNRIMGDSTDKGYEDWIRLNSFQMGLGVGVAPPTGADGRFNFSQPSISEVTLSHAFDGAVLAILADVLVAKGNQGRQATLELVERGGKGPVTTMQLELDNVLFSGISFSSGGGLPNVTESLNFSGYTQRIWDIDPRTGLRSEQASVFSYDMLTGKVRDTAPAAFAGDGFDGKGNLSGLNTAASEIQLPPAGGLAPVPEPSTYAMLLLGLGGLGVVARRRGQRGRAQRL
jgi:type VI secretion system secreted protein Hcp